MDRITDAFAWPVRDPEWAGKVAVMALILVVPIAGAINGLGWMLAAIDRLRAGDENLPAANFSYLGRGFSLFVVNLVYGLTLGLIVAALVGATIFVGGAEGRGPVNAAMVALVVVLDMLIVSFGTLGSLALYFAMPAIVLATDRRGMAGGLDVAGVVRDVRASWVNALIAGLMLIAVGFVGGLGVLACVVGVFFTSAYALAMQAWVIRSYELGTAAPASA